MELGTVATTSEIAEVIRDARKRQRVTQRALALASGTGIRFIIDLEKGKDTCEIGKVLTILNTLRIRLTLTPPSLSGQGE